MKIQLHALLCLTAFIAHPSVACEPTVTQMEESARRDRAIEEKYVTELFRRADYVVVAVVRDVHDSNNASYAQVAELDVERVIKGPSVKSVSALMYKITQPTVHGDDETKKLEMVSCDAPYDPTSEDPYIIEGARALFYVGKGVLLRVNPFPIEPELMRFNVKDELHFLNKQKHGR